MLFKINCLNVRERHFGNSKLCISKSVLRSTQTRSYMSPAPFLSQGFPSPSQHLLICQVSLDLTPAFPVCLCTHAASPAGRLFCGDSLLDCCMICILITVLQSSCPKFICSDFNPSPCDSIRRLGM